MATVDLKTGGMHCSSCSMLIEMTLDELPGVSSASADYRSGVARVEFDPAVVSVDRIIAAVIEAGYTAEAA